MQFMLGMLVGGMIGATIGAIVVGACAMAAKADEDELRRRPRSTPRPTLVSHG
ncbi:gas vesicle protein [Bradyrhizobium japonicum]